MTVRYYPGTTDPDLSARATDPTAQASKQQEQLI